MGYTDDFVLKKFYNDIIYKHASYNQGGNKFFTREGVIYKVTSEGNSKYEINAIIGTNSYSVIVKDSDGKISKKLKEFKKTTFPKKTTLLKKKSPVAAKTGAKTEKKKEGKPLPVRGGEKAKPKLYAKPVLPEKTYNPMSIREDAVPREIPEYYYQDETVDENEVGAFYRETKFKLDGKPVYRILNKDLSVMGEQFFIFESDKNNGKIFLAKTGDSWHETGRSAEPEVCEQNQEVGPKSAPEYKNVGELKQINSAAEGTKAEGIALSEGKTLSIENTLYWESIEKKTVIAYAMSGNKKIEKIEYDIDYSKKGAIIITKKTKNLSNNSEEKMKISYDFEKQKAYIIG